MVSADTAMPMPESGPSIAPDWMKANVVAAAIYGLVGALTFSSDALLGMARRQAERRRQAEMLDLLRHIAATLDRQEERARLDEEARREASSHQAG